MKTILSFSVVLAACAFLYFAAPYYRRNPNSFQACTLHEIYRKFFADISSTEGPRIILFFLLGSLVVATLFYPAVLVLLARWIAAAGQSGNFLFVTGGVLAALGAAVNWSAMLLSHTSFAFGGSNSNKGETYFFWIIPAFQGAFAAFSITLGSSVTVAGWVTRWLQR